MDTSLGIRSSNPETTAAAHPSTAGAAQQFQPLELPIAEPFRTSKTFAISKLALGTLNLLVAIISLSLTVTKFRGIGAWPFYLNLYFSFAVASIIWHLTEHITLACRRDWRSICPGAHVGVHLILWVLAVIVVSFYCSDLASVMYHHDTPNCTDFYCQDSASPSSTGSDANGYLAIMGALTALNVMLLVLHFTLFVMACIEMDRRSGYERKRKIVYLVAAPGTADGRMYYTPLDQPLQGNRAVDHHSQACSSPAVE